MTSALVDFFVFLHRHRACLRARLVGELGRDPTRAEALRRYRHAFAHMQVVRSHAHRRLRCTQRSAMGSRAMV